MSARKGRRREGRRRERRKAPSYQGWVYFIGETGTEYVKIGVTFNQDVEQRRKALQTGNPRKLEVLAARLAADAFGAENDFHWLFDSERAEGEWFYRNAEIDLFIKSLSASGPTPGDEENQFARSD
jgi:hypothetical protein